MTERYHQVLEVAGRIQAIQVQLAKQTQSYSALATASDWASWRQSRALPFNRWCSWVAGKREGGYVARVETANSTPHDSLHHERLAPSQPLQPNSGPAAKSDIKSSGDEVVGSSGGAFGSEAGPESRASQIGLRLRGAQKPGLIYPLWLCGLPLDGVHAD